MTTQQQTAIAFFKEHGAARHAKSLANAEAWLASQPGHQIQWLRDFDYDPNDYDVKDMPNIGWGCIVQIGGNSASLWAITFDGDHWPQGNPYARVVVAELALELMHD